MNGKPPEKATGFNEHNISLTQGKRRFTPRSRLGGTLEKNIMIHLAAARDSGVVEGLGKYDLKRILMEADDYMNMSINTIKRAVDRLLGDGKIECVNPDDERGLRFRVREVVKP